MYAHTVESPLDQEVLKEQYVFVVPLRQNAVICSNLFKKKKLLHSRAPPSVSHESKRGNGTHHACHLHEGNGIADQMEKNRET